VSQNTRGGCATTQDHNWERCDLNTRMAGGAGAGRGALQAVDSLSQRSLVCLVCLCFLTFASLVGVIVRAVPSDCRTRHNNPGGKADLPPVNISGVFQLERAQNYMEYLKALEIPESAARHIQEIK